MQHLENEPVYDIYRREKCTLTFPVIDAHVSLTGSLVNGMTTVYDNTNKTVHNGELKPLDPDIEDTKTAVAKTHEFHREAMNSPAFHEEEAMWREKVQGHMLTTPRLHQIYTISVIFECIGEEIGPRYMLYSGYQQQRGVNLAKQVSRTRRKVHDQTVMLMPAFDGGDAFTLNKASSSSSVRMHVTSNNTFGSFGSFNAPSAQKRKMLPSAAPDPKRKNTIVMSKKQKTHNQMPTPTHLSQVRSAIISHEMGMGKTLTLLMAALLFKGIVFGAVPQTLIEQWYNQYKQHFRDISNIMPMIVIDSCRDVKAVRKRMIDAIAKGPCFFLMSTGIFRCNIDRVLLHPDVRAAYEPFYKVLLIVDENDHARTPSTILCQSISQFPCYARLMSSATPFHNACREEWIAHAKMLGIIDPAFRIRGSDSMQKQNMEDIRNYVAKRMVRLVTSDAGITLPGCRYHRVSIELSPPERELYLYIVQKMQSYRRRSKGKLITGDAILRYMTRLRQAAIDADILPLSLFTGTGDHESGEEAPCNEHALDAYLHENDTTKSQKEEENKEDSDSDSYWSEVVMDEGTVGPDIDPPPWNEGSIGYARDIRNPRLNDIDIKLPTYSSTNLWTARMCAKMTTNRRRTIVAAYWRSAIVNIERYLDMFGVKHLRVDGKMGRKEKDKTIEMFRTHEDYRVLLLTIRTGSHGLHIPEASCVIFSQPGYNPQLERQMITRLHRVGQSRVVDVYWVLSNYTIEHIVHASASRKAEINDRNMGTEATSDFTFHHSFYSKAQTYTQIENVLIQKIVEESANSTAQPSSTAQDEIDDLNERMFELATAYIPKTQL